MSTSIRKSTTHKYRRTHTYIVLNATFSIGSVREYWRISQAIYVHDYKFLRGMFWTFKDFWDYRMKRCVHGFRFRKNRCLSTRNTHTLCTNKNKFRSLYRWCIFGPYDDNISTQFATLAMEFRAEWQNSWQCFRRAYSLHCCCMGNTYNYCFFVLRKNFKLF